MAFPQILTPTTSGVESDTTTHTVTLPATTIAGELLLIYSSINDQRTFTPPTGWTLIRELGIDANSGAVFGKVASGAEGGTTVDFTTSAVTRSASCAIRVTDWNGTLSDVEVSTGNSAGSTNFHNPDSITASWGSADNLFIASGHIRKGNLTVVAWPTNYLDNQTDYNTAAGSGGAHIAIASRELAAATDDPDPFQTTGGTTNSVSFTTVVRPDPAAATFGITGITPGPYYEGDSVTINVENANATGKTLSIPAGSITVDSQNATEMVFTVPDPKIFGTKTTSYVDLTTITADDAGATDTVDIAISPTVGDDYATVAALTGIFEDDVGLEIGDKAYGYFVSGSGSVMLEYGAISPAENSTYRYWIQDDTDSTWGNSADEVFVVGSAPVLTSPTGTATAYNTADGTVSTDTGTGTLYYLFSENAVESIATVKASGDSQAVSATGVQNVSVTGLTGSTTYYAHYVHTEGTDSAVATSASFSTPAAPDVTPPVLTLPTGQETGDTTADGSVTTDEGNGTLYYYVSENATETAATIKASGQSQSVTLVGKQDVSVTGLSSSTTYYFHFVQDDAATNESNAISSTSFTTTDTVSPVLTNAVGQPTGATTANIRVTTDEGNGTLYYLVSQNASETAIAIKAGSSQAVTATGVQNIPVTGLTEGLTYYAHFVQDDAATNESNVISSSSFVPEEITLIPGASNEQLIAFFRAQTGSNSYQFNELAKIYYKQVAATQGAFNDLLQAAQEAGGFVGYAPIDWRNF